VWLVDRLSGISLHLTDREARAAEAAARTLMDRTRMQDQEALEALTEIRDALSG
jgi:hypothetical protein